MTPALRLLAIVPLIALARLSAGDPADATGVFTPRRLPFPTTVDLSGDTSRQVVVAAGDARTYQGHPTTVLLPDGRTMYAVWTINHGGPCGPMKRSDDGGLTWSNLLPVPESWQSVRNCPAIYRLMDPAGTARLIVFAGRGPDGTMHRSHSVDGRTWTPMESTGLECVMPFCTIEPIDGGKRLLGLTNIRRPGETREKRSNVIAQSHSSDGGLTWTPWRVVLDLPGSSPCEPWIVRSPDSRQLLVLMRENARRESLYMTSDDEGRTWSQPRKLPPGLYGDRHVARYAPDGRLVVVMRDTGGQYGSPTAPHFVAWVGRYEDIAAGRDGEYRVKLLHSHKGGDNGYPGLELLPDGTFVATTYIKYREGPEKNSVVSTRFKLAETDRLAERAPARTTRVSEGRSEPANTPVPVILVSMDGFRHDYLERYTPPALTRLAAMSATARAMRPAFPTRTFPNHYTLVTGWHPVEHGIMGNSVEGGPGRKPLTMNTADAIDWWEWRGEPIWVTAGRQGLVTATMFWPASTATIHGRRPTYSHPFSREFTHERRVGEILKWLDLPPGERPSFLSLYFEDADVSGHATGPWSKATRDAVLKVDAAIGLLIRGLEERKLLDAVNLVVTSDHGMTEITPGDRAVYIADFADLGNAVAEGAAQYAIVRPRGEDPRALLERLKTVPHARAFLVADAPRSLYFGRFQDPQAILVLADDGWTLKTGRRPLVTPPDPLANRTRGTHGYDNSYESMKVPFIAHGPAFKHGVRMEEFESVHVYRLLAHLLGIVPAPNSGQLDPFGEILVSAKPAEAR